MKIRALRNILPLVLLTRSSTTSAQPVSSTTLTTSPSFTSPSTTTSTNTSTPTTTPRPIYAIAHRVLTASALSAALSHGANAVEIDLSAKTYEWYADHDNSLDSARSTARALFTAIADARKSGSNISFVWLDIKSPDECVAGRGCSIEALRDLAREVLGQAGIAVLYGFYAQEGSRGFEVVSADLRAKEAVVLSGNVGEVEGWFDGLANGTSSTNTSVTVAAGDKVMDYGAVDLTSEAFGSCDGADGICSVLRAGSDAQAEGQIGAVMAWTTAEGQGWMVEKMLGQAGVDGIIYGLSSGEYADSNSTKAAYLDIESYVKNHGDSMRMATIQDVPW